VNPGEDERAGRWSGSAKKECGLHVLPDQEQGSGI
jgi:phosphoadenosine phosphosulfate reductase